MENKNLKFEESLKETMRSVSNPVSISFEEFNNFKIEFINYLFENYTSDKTLEEVLFNPNHYIDGHYKINDEYVFKIYSILGSLHDENCYFSLLIELASGKQFYFRFEEGLESFIQKLKSDETHLDKKEAHLSLLRGSYLQLNLK